MDLLPLIVNPTPQSIPGQPTPAPSSGDPKQQFQSLLPNLKLPAAATNDTPPETDDQKEADTLAALELISQLVGLAQIVSANDSSNATNSSNASPGTVVATGITTPPIPVNLPVQSGDGSVASTSQKPLSGLLLAAATQLLQNAGVSENSSSDQNSAANQNGNQQAASADSPSFQIPAGFHPVPAPVAVKLETQSFTTTAPGSQNQVQTAPVVQVASASEADNLPVQPVISTNQIVAAAEQNVPQGTNDSDDASLVEISNVVTVATVQADATQPAPVPVPNDQASPISGSSQQQSHNGSAGEQHQEVIQTLLTTQDSVQEGTENSAPDNIPAPVAQEPVVAVQAPEAPEVNISEAKPATLPASHASPPPGVNQPVQGKAHREIHAVADLANTPPVPAAETSTDTLPKADAPVTTTDTRRVVPQSETASPQSDVNGSTSTPERRPDDSRSKTSTTRAPIVPIGFALNPQHFAIQTDVKGAQAAASDVTDRAESAGVIHPSDLPSPAFSAPSAVPQVPDTPEPTVPVQVIRPQEVVPQLTHAIASASNEHQSIRVELKPEELGHVRIEVQQHDGVMVASIEVERPSTAHLMADSLSQLHDSLQAAGINVERIDLSTAPPPPSGDSLNSSSQWGRSNSQASTQQEQSGSRQPPEQQRRSEFRRDEPQRPQPTRIRNRILDIDVTI